MSGKGLRNLAVVSMQKPAPERLAGLAGASGARLIVLHVEAAACAAAVALSGGSSQLRTALAAASELLPPFGGVLHAPVAPRDAAAAAAAVEAALAAAAAQPVAVTAEQALQAVVAESKPVHATPDVPAMRRTIVAAIASLLGEAAAAGVGGDEPLMSAGLTSTLAVQLTQQLEEGLGTELPGTLVFDYPSINEMTAFLAAELAGAGSAAAPAAAIVPPSVMLTPPRRAGPPAMVPPAPAARRALLTVPPAPPAASKAQQEASATAIVLQQVAQLLGASAADLSADTPLMTAGVTSTLAVQLTQRLEEAVGAEMPGTLVFDYPTAAEIAGFLVAEGLLQQPSGTGAAAPAPAVTPGAAVPAAASATRVAAGSNQQQQQRALLVELVLREAAGLAGGASISADAPLMSAGLTSALAVQLVAALEAAAGAELPGTLVFDYPTGAIARAGCEAALWISGCYF